MHWCVTIACATGNNNRFIYHLLPICCLFGSLVAVPGCASPPPAPVVSDAVSELTSAKPIALGTSLEGRIDYDRPLPKQLTQKMSNQFTLVTIRRAEDWEYLWRRMHVSGKAPVLDFSAGTVVGILANVGEYAQRGSPIHIESIQAKDKEGLLVAKLSPGAYYTIETAGYIRLTYAPEVDTIRIVRINQSTFTIGPRQHQLRSDNHKQGTITH